MRELLTKYPCLTPSGFPCDLAPMKDPTVPGRMPLRCIALRGERVRGGVRVHVDSTERRVTPALCDRARGPRRTLIPVLTYEESAGQGKRLPTMYEDSRSQQAPLLSWMSLTHTLEHGICRCYRGLGARFGGTVAAQLISKLEL